MMHGLDGLWIYTRT